MLVMTWRALSMSPYPAHLTACTVPSPECNTVSDRCPIHPLPFSTSCQGTPLVHFSRQPEPVCH